MLNEVIAAAARSSKSSTGCATPRPACGTSSTKAASPWATTPIWCWSISHRTRTIRNDEQLTKCGWSAWDGVELTGWPVRTWVLGREVFRDGRIDEYVRGGEAQFDHARGGYWATARLSDAHADCDGDSTLASSRQVRQAQLSCLRRQFVSLWLSEKFLQLLRTREAVNQTLRAR